MKKSMLFFLFFGIIILLNSACETSVNNLVGTWYYTSIEISDCDDPNENDAQAFPGDGDCDGAMLCTRIFLEMTEDTYSIRQTNTSDPLEVPTVLEEGTYHISTTVLSQIQFCTDLLCREVTYSISNNVITLESVELASGCTNRVVAEK